MTNTHPCPVKIKGFTVVEVMIAVVIGIVLVGMTLTVFTNNKRAYNQNNQFIELQSAINFSLSVLVDNMTNVGFYGGVNYQDPIDTSLASISADCGGSSVGTAGVDLITNPAGALQLAMPLWGKQATANSEFGCITNAKIGSDIIVLKSVAGETIDNADLGNEIYLRSGKDEGQIFIGPSNNATISNSANMNWVFQNYIFYISSANQLVRKTLVRNDNTTVVYEEQVLAGTGATGASGIEDMQIMYGIDSDSDGIANYFVDASDISVSPINLWYNIVIVKIYLLGRGPMDASYTDTKNYQLGDKTVTAANLDDNYHRKVISTSVLLRNNWYRIQGGL